MNLETARPTTSAIYRQRIQKAIDYIDANLDGVIRLDDLALVSHFSAYHFHRIFQATLGETVNDYVTRKRMERAVYRLLEEPVKSVTEVAVTGGFSSSANFAKAFKMYFGISPSELRNAGRVEDKEITCSKIGKIYSKYGKAFNARDLYSQFVTDSKIFEPDKLKEILMKIRVETMEAKEIVFLSSKRGYELDSVYDAWDSLINWAESKGVESDWSTRFAICHDNPAITPEHKCRYDAAVVVNHDMPVSEPFQKSHIPAGKYAVAGFRDVASKINQFMTELCSQWLCNSGYEPDNFPPIFNYFHVDKDSEMVEMDVYIKLKSLA